MGIPPEHGAERTWDCIFNPEALALQGFGQPKPSAVLKMSQQALTLGAEPELVRAKLVLVHSHGGSQLWWIHPRFLLAF